MAGTSLFMLLDDIASTLDDVALMTKVAAKKTTGVLGDDLALNAEQVAGVRAERELPTVWAVAKGSFKNKMILVPLALAVSAFAPWAVTPMLMLGGAYLCFEGVEKVVHALLHPHTGHPATEPPAAATAGDPLAHEKEKIQGAIRTDFILSGEIIVITLGTVAGAPFMQQVVVVAGIALVMTLGVYGLVAAIVKLDDGGLYLSTLAGTGAATRCLRGIGRAVLLGAPYMMKLLSVVGTVAMFLVGGGILMHGIPGAHELAHHVTQAAGDGFLRTVLSSVLDAVVGIIAGALVLAGTTLWGRFKKAAG